MLFGKRKVILINPSFQYRVVGFFVGMFSLSLIINLLTINLFFMKFKNLGIKNGLNESDMYFNFLSNQQFQLNLYFLISSLIVLIVIIVGGFYLSHKVAGPLYRLVHDIQKNIERKEFKEINFRKGDFFMEVQDSFNAYNRYLRENKSE